MYTLGFSVETGDEDNVTYVFDTLSTIIEGMLIAMLYFTEIKNKFISSWNHYSHLLCNCGVIQKEGLSMSLDFLDDFVKQAGTDSLKTKA